MSPAADSAPLTAISVLDASRSLGGSYLTQLLADFGAEVTKVEPPGGDPLRERADAFKAYNRDKRRVELDVTDPHDATPFLERASDADVVVESFHDDTMDRNGIGYTALAARNPTIVYVSLTPYGSGGPLSGRRGADLAVLGRSGILDLCGELDGPPLQPVVQLAELGGGALPAAFGTLLALLDRARTGRGCRVDACALDGSLSLLAPLVVRFMRDGRDPERGAEPLRGGLTCYMAYPCKDGWVTVSALERDRWTALCRALSREDLVDHHMDLAGGWVQGELEQVFMRGSLEEWRSLGDEHDCGLDPVLTLRAALSHDHVRARRLIDEDGVVAAPIRLSRASE